MKTGIIKNRQRSFNEAKISAKRFVQYFFFYMKVIDVTLKIFLPKEQLLRMVGNNDVF